MERNLNWFNTVDTVLTRLTMITGSSIGSWDTMAMVDSPGDSRRLKLTDI